MKNRELAQLKFIQSVSQNVLLPLFLWFSLSLLFGQTDYTLTSLEHEQYRSLKQGLVSAPNLKAQSVIGIPQDEQINAALTSAYTSEDEPDLCTDGYIPPDDTYETFVGGLGPLPGDDQSQLVEIPFTFIFCNGGYSRIYININGNITFNQPLAIFSPTGFPINTPMVAAFWADVDLNGTGSIRYKINPTNMIITWDHVGYYNAQTDKVNSFQMIITDGTDPIIGVGNSMQFRYDDMQWTTGNASGGVNGFGGFPATVGFNSGNSSNFEQVGRFDHPGYDYDGPFGLVDGVDWLDDQCFVFTQDNPPVAQCQDVTVQLDAAGNGFLTVNEVDNGSADDCGAVTLDLDSVSFNCSNIGLNSVILTVTDASGQVSQCEAMVSVIDSVSPTAACQDVTVSLDDNGQANLPEDFADAGSGDACGSIDYDTDITEFTCGDANEQMPTMVTMTVTDASGNTTSCTALVSINNAAVDSDCDGVGDACDICPNGDDSVDNSGPGGEPDGVPDCAQNLDIDEYIDDWQCGNNSKKPKLLVCHRPPGNPDNFHTICISPIALQAHLNHGDVLGPCIGCAEALNMERLSQQFEMDEEYEVYPNPASHELTIRHPAIAEGDAQIRITNSQGIVVWSVDLKRAEASLVYRIDLDDYESITPGLHFISVIQNENVSTTQLIVIR